MNSISNVSFASSNEVATEVVPARVALVLYGETLAERKMSVIKQGATPATLMALAAAKGAIGKEARSHAEKTGGQLVMQAASNSNYRPLAELYSATTGYDIVIANRSAFENLPNVIDALINAVTATKSKGMTINKQGESVPNAKHAALLGIRSVAVDCIDYAAKVHAERAAKRIADEAAKGDNA